MREETARPTSRTLARVASPVARLGCPVLALVLVTMGAPALGTPPAHGSSHPGLADRSPPFHASAVESAVQTSASLFQPGGKLTAAGEAGAGFFGFSVALSADGNTALVGAPVDDAAWVFTRSDSTWSQGQELTSSELTAKAQFGTSVALSGDGQTALIGAPHDGTAWVFTRSGSTWSQHPEKLADNVNDYGVAVALSSDGRTALVGAPGELGEESGTAIVYTRPDSSWTEQASLSPKTGEGGEESLFGSAVALSLNGSTALVGAPFHGEAFGAAWAFARSGESWAQQGKRLEPAEEINAAEYGTSLALSGDGNTALIAGPIAGGAVGVFTRLGSTWSQQGGLLTGANPSGEERFGRGVALSEDGNTALIGAPGEGGGGAWLFTRSASTWTRQGSEIGGCEEVGEGGFGGAVALSGDATTALVGGSRDNANVGAVWPFVTSSGSVCSPSGGGGREQPETTTTPGTTTPLGSRILPGTKITKTKINAKKRMATFSFTGIGTTTAFQCELIASSKKRHHKRTNAFATCQSPKGYKHLAPGRYTFAVRALDGSESDPTPAKNAFKIR